MTETKKAVSIQVFNEEKNYGEVHTFVDKVEVDRKYYRIENGKEVFFTPEEPIIPAYFVPLPDGFLDKLENELPTNIATDGSFEGNLSLHNPIDGTFIAQMRQKTIAFQDKNTEICLDTHDPEKNEEISKKIKSLSPEDVGKLIQTLSDKGEITTTIEGKTRSTNPFYEIEQAVNEILSPTYVAPKKELFKTIDQKTEFGISRFVSDRYTLLPQLLENSRLVPSITENSYMIIGKVDDSNKNTISIEHNFIASSDEDAEKIYKVLMEKMQGIQHKIWMSAWSLANELKRFVYTVPLTELMRMCYPDREAKFQTLEKIDFYSQLKILENTKMVFSRRDGRSDKKKPIDTEIRILEIIGRSPFQEGMYPNEITIRVLNEELYQKEVMAFVGASYKHTTLELASNDTLLAQTIQTRKSQLRNDKHITFDRDYLIKLSGLQVTDGTKKSRANALLIAKLNRLKEKGIIKEAPKKIMNTITLTVR